MNIGHPKLSPLRRAGVFTAVVAFAFVGGAVAVIAFHAGAFTATSASASQDQRFHVGGQLPDATVTTVDGRKASLRDFVGHPLWLNFFATWCPPCKAEMPAIEQRYERFSGSGLVVVGVDQQEAPVDVRRFATPRGLTFPLVVDGGAAAARYQIAALPTSIFVDASGVVRYVSLGQLTSREMDGALRTIGFH